MNKRCTRETPACDRCDKARAECLYGVNDFLRRETAWGKTCLNCRTRKKKCDLAKPSCSRCSGLEISCEYAGVSFPAVPTQSTLVESFAINAMADIISASEAVEQFDSSSGLAGLSDYSGMKVDDPDLKSSVLDWQLLKRLLQENPKIHIHSVQIFSWNSVLDSFLTEPPAFCFAILACSVLVHTPRMPSSWSMAFYTKARKCYVLDESQSIRMVQTLFMFAGFAFVKRQPYHGLVALTRSAHMALHLKLEIDPDDLPILASLNEEEKDERRRIFWILYYTLKMAQIHTGDNTMLPEGFKTRGVKAHRAYANGSILPETSSVYHISQLLDIFEILVEHAANVPNSAACIIANRNFDNFHRMITDWHMMLPPHLHLIPTKMTQFLKNEDRYGILELSNLYLVGVCILNRHRLYFSGIVHSDKISAPKFEEIAKAIASSFDAASDIAAICSQLIEYTSITDSNSAELHTPTSVTLTAGFWNQAQGVGFACFEAAVTFWYSYSRIYPEYLQACSRYSSKMSYINLRNEIRTNMEVLKSTLYLLETAQSNNGMSIAVRSYKPNMFTPLLDCLKGMIAEINSIDAGRQVPTGTAVEIENILFEMQVLSLEDESSNLSVVESQDPPVFLGLLGMDVNGCMQWRGRHEGSWRKFWKKCLQEDFF
ncbi:hypothetical protein HK100_001177 [Physocladia obscura]|uniref:Zn(2)-C6 fungal-type domain-containing protein n=1 Tax=Physocladia obscura TaxID=109957 RepID=A0AAD5XEQ1_9FUNG|nr:hypothetical protein HK100_001177 [Physocladia obscura]